MELPGYDVHELIGFGPNGEVWRAREHATQRVVALKRLRGAAARGRERLLSQAATLGSIAGPHVVALHDVLAVGDDLVVVLDLAAGGSLATLLDAHGRLTPGEVVTLLAPLAQLLALAHERGIVHGAISPGNVLFAADGRPMLSDFGLVAGGDPARDVRALASLAMTALGPDSHGAVADAIADASDDARALAAAVACAAPAIPISFDSPPALRAHLTQPAREPRVNRRLAVVAVGVVAFALAVLVGLALGRHSGVASAVSLPAVPVPTVSPTAEPPPRWLDVVRRLDDLRAQAFTTGDAVTLSRVYAPGSAALIADKATVAVFARRGWRARGFRATVVRVALRSSASASVTLEVVDALSAYDVVDAAGHVVAKGRARPARSIVMRLVDIDGVWLVGSVS